MATAVYPSMVPGASEPKQVLLVKACYWAQLAAENAGSVGANGPYVNNAAAYNDHLNVLETKLAYWCMEIALNS